MATTKEQVGAAITAIKAIADAIRELGEVPSGHLYAQLMGKMSLADYTKVIDILKGATLVSESGNLLKWIGPKFDGGAK
jgi:hypothetical protein